VCVWKNAEGFNITLENTYNNHGDLKGWAYFYVEEGFTLFLNANWLLRPLSRLRHQFLVSALSFV